MSTPVNANITAKDVQRCPVCGSDMIRNKTDNPHNIYVGQYTCCNQQCNVEATFRN